MEEQERMAREAMGKSPFNPSAWDKENNPFLLDWFQGHVDIFSRMDDLHLGKAMYEFQYRDKCIGKYGFAVPTESALREILKVSPKGIVEIGAGSGYWSKLLQLLGADVIACDDCSGVYTFKVGEFFPVQPVGYEKIFRTKSIHERTLLVVWPNTDNLKIFNKYRGDTVVYVGEISEGCTGYDSKIEKTWELVKEIEIPVWTGIHDSLGIFKRKGR
jgi:hypothetical protein